MCLRKALIFLVVTILGCAHQGEKGDTFSEQVLNDAIEDARKKQEIPEFIDRELFSGVENGYGREERRQDRFDISVKDMPAKTFFMNLTSGSPINIVAHPEVNGRISLDLNSVTVDEILDVVRDVYGYEYRKQGAIYTIYPRKLRTEIFPINYIDIKRVGITDTNVSIGEIESSSSDEGGSGGGGKSTQSADLLGVGGSSGGGMRPGARVQTLNKTDFWNMLEKTINNIISVPNQGRSVMVNPQAGLVVVTGMPTEIQAVRMFLDRSELSVKRQVVLETQIVEVQLSEGFEAGIDWTAIQGSLEYSSNYTRNKIVDQGSAVEDLHQYGPRMFKSVFNILDIRDFLSLLESQGSVQVLSSPRVSTVNNQKAVIRVGSDEFFVTGVKNNTTSTAATTTFSPELELSSFFSGISLDVTPQISDTGDVILHIHPIVSDVTDQIKEVTVGDSKITLPLAYRDIRESDSIVRAKSGQVIVLGGLMQRTDKNTDSKQPWLGDVPIINAFFKSKKSLSKKTELVILLKPTVVDGHTWNNQLDQYRDLGKMTGEEYRGR